MAATLLTNLLSNGHLASDKDLFLDAMQEVTDNILGRAEQLPPNPYLTNSSKVRHNHKSFASSLPPRSNSSNLVIATHHSALSTTQPSHSTPKIPVHHLSPLNNAATGPKGKNEQLSELKKLRVEKQRAVQDAKEIERKQRIQPTRKSVSPSHSLSHSSVSHSSVPPPLSVDSDGDSDTSSAASPAPSYVSSGSASNDVAASAMEDVLTGGQVKCLRRVFRRCEEGGGVVESGRVAGALREDGGVGDAFGGHFVESGAAAIERQGGGLSYDEVVSLFISPASVRGEGTFARSMASVKHVDPMVSLDFSAINLRNLAN